MARVHIFMSVLDTKLNEKLLCIASGAYKCKRVHLMWEFTNQITPYFTEATFHLAHVPNNNFFLSFASDVQFEFLTMIIITKPNLFLCTLQTFYSRGIVYKANFGWGSIIWWQKYHLAVWISTVRVYKLLPLLQLSYCKLRVDSSPL